MQVLRPSGRVLLLEHGRSGWAWLNSVLDADASKHHEKWGCWWNRDIEKIVADAGLTVVSARRWHFGTTYVLTCVVGPSPE